MIRLTADRSMIGRARRLPPRPSGHGRPVRIELRVVAGVDAPRPAIRSVVGRAPGVTSPRSNPAACDVGIPLAACGRSAIVRSRSTRALRGRSDAVSAHGRAEVSYGFLPSCQMRWRAARPYRRAKLGQSPDQALVAAVRSLRLCCRGRCVHSRIQPPNPFRGELTADQRYR